MTDVDAIAQKIRREFASKGGKARAHALTAAERRRIARLAGSAPKKQKTKQ